MKLAVRIIAICEVIRIVQNAIQLSMMIGEKQMRKNLNNEFINSLKKDDREWAEDLLNDFLKYKEGCENCKYNGDHDGVCKNCTSTKYPCDIPTHYERAE